jgi:DNA polymerase III subunit epsilon
MKNPINFFDTETTGVDPVKDRIVSLSAKIVEDFITVDELSLLINPGVSIPAEASNVHGITDEMVKDQPTFKDVALIIYDFFQKTKVVAGYNILSFDIPLLSEEFLRVGLELDFTNKLIVDAKKIFFLKEERTLSAAVRFYCGKQHEEAHDAMGDVNATIDVLQGQMRMYQDLPQDYQGLHEMCSAGNKMVDAGGKFVLNEKGVIVFNFSDKKGLPALSDPGFLKWMLTKDFPLSTKKTIKTLLSI